MQVIVESGRQVFADDALPFALSGSKVGLIGSKILDELQTYILLQERLGFFEFFFDEFGSF